MAFLNPESFDWIFRLCITCPVNTGKTRDGSIHIASGRCADNRIRGRTFKEQNWNCEWNLSCSSPHQSFANLSLRSGLKRGHQMGQATTKIQDEQPNEIQQEIRDESIQDKQQNEDLPQTSNLELLSQIDFKQVLAQSRSFPPSSSSSSSSSSEDEAFIYPRNQPSMPPSPATTPPLVSSLQPPTLPSLLYKKNGRNSTNPTYEEWSAMKS